ncbi:MAG: hypothetical protein ACU85E_06285, partial [Gammaproteobacteria bacterium]
MGYAIFMCGPMVSTIEKANPNRFFGHSKIGNANIVVRAYSGSMFDSLWTTSGVTLRSISMIWS